jgi:hypothetical protein
MAAQRIDAKSLVLGIVLGLVLSLGSQFLILNQSFTAQQQDLVVESNNDAARITDLLAAVNERDDRISSLQNEIKVLQHPWNATSHPNPTEKRFAASMSSFLHGVARVAKDDFLETFDFGLPEVIDADRVASQTEVLLLYNTPGAIPSSLPEVGFASGPLLSVKEATSKCETLNVVSIGDPNAASKSFLGAQCLALVGHEQMYHVQRFVTDDGFKLVHRRLIKKDDKYDVPYSFFEAEEARLHREFLIHYLPRLDTVLARLKPVLAKISVDNTVVAMVCSMSQFSLLLNFACACHARGISIPGNIIIFATDKETAKLARELDFATFYDDEVFGRQDDSAPEHMNIVTAKVVACHLVNLLGYDILFQDVDIVWYKDPLQLFRDPTYSKFDIMFADDGSRWALQLPYAANTGFFYARNNERTRHLFRSWLFNLEILFAAFGDQPVMNTILPEESSLTGLRVKVLKIEEFPCGNTLYEPRYRDFRKDLLENKRNNTYILHVNWTHKREKVGFVKQLGIYYVQENCTEGQEGERITFNSAKSDASFMDTCCSSKPIGVRCHFPDKPSVIPCNEEQ